MQIQQFGLSTIHEVHNNLVVRPTLEDILVFLYGVLV